MRRLTIVAGATMAAFAVAHADVVVMTDVELAQTVAGSAIQSDASATASFIGSENVSSTASASSTTTVNDGNTVQAASHASATASGDNAVATSSAETTSVSHSGPQFFEMPLNVGITWWVLR